MSESDRSPEDARGQQKLASEPFEQHVNSDREIDVECLTCGRSTRLYAFAGGDWPWKHDMINGDHVVSYDLVEVSDA